METTLSCNEIEEMRTYVRDHLRLVMRDISEDFFAAGWTGGLEYYLWRVLQEPDKGTGYLGGLERSTRQSILRLANLAGGWWVWGREDDAERFVPMGEWESMYRTWYAPSQNPAES